MLEEVRITGLGVIEDAVLEFSSGFTVVTGETGAGKTMVVTGLGLMFGGRADPARVRPGTDRATVEGRLQIEAEGHVARQVLEAGGELDDDGRALIVSRSVSAEGRSRAYAGGRSVPVSLLTYLADDLVAVHGQADQQQLLRAVRQREALDEFAGPALAAVLADYQRVYARHREVLAELNELTARARERAQEAEELQRALEEIERAEPAEGEDAALLAEEERLATRMRCMPPRPPPTPHCSAIRRTDPTRAVTRSRCSAARARPWTGCPRTIRCSLAWQAGFPRRYTSSPTSPPSSPPTWRRWTATRRGSRWCRNAGPS